jgi:hypothetical protein
VNAKESMTKPTCAAWPIAIAAVLISGGCINVKSEPIEIKPIYITMDINLRVQRELEEFFDFEETAAPARAPSTAEASKE